MKILFITSIYKEAEVKEVERLKKEIKELNFTEYEFYCSNNIKDNIGYAAGINKGIKYGMKNNFDIFVVMNPDISITSLTKDQILLGLKKYDILGFAMMQDKKVYYGGKIDKWRMSGGLIEKKPIDKYINVDFVSGSLMFIKKEVVDKIGLFDESYFIYYEEVDYCLRAKMAGFISGIDSTSVYDHLEISKTNNPRKDYFLTKNRLKFFLKFSSFKQKIREFFRIPKTLLESIPFVKKTILNSSFLMNFFSMNISSFVNKLFQFVLFIFLVRYFPPEKYGIYTLVWAFIGLFSPILDFGTTSYGLLYSHKDKDRFFSPLLSLRMVLSLIVTVIALIAAFLSLNNQLAIYVLFTSSVFLSNAWSGSYLIINSVKNSVFKSSLISLLFNFILSASLILSTIIFKNISIIFQVIFFLYFAYTILNIFLLNKSLGKIKLDFKIASWTKILKKSYVFVLIGFFAGIYFKQDVFLLNYLKSSKEVGIYSSGYKFFEALLFIPGSYNITSTPNLAKLGNSIGLLKSKVKKDMYFLFALGMGIAIFFYFLSPHFLNLFLKGNYHLGIKVAQVVMFALPFILLDSIFLNVLYVFEQQWTVVFIFICQILINFILNYLFIPKFSYMACAYITVFAEIVNFTLAYSFARKYLK